MRFQVVHRTEYIYRAPASLSYNEARLVPRPVQLPQVVQRCEETKIEIEPAFTDYRERTDYFGNKVIFYTIRQAHSQTVITASTNIEIQPNRSFDADVVLGPAGSISWEDAVDHLLASTDPDCLEARQFRLNSPLVSVFPGLERYARPSFQKGRPLLESVHNLMERIHRDLDFVPGDTTIATPLKEVLRMKRGVCQDYAHLMVGCLRSQGLAVRYVSGYIETLPPPGEEKLQGADASHAWCSVFVPDVGWIDFDPTNNLLPADQHIYLGWGRDFSDVTPLKGVFFSTGSHKLTVSVDVQRLEPSSVTSPRQP